MRGKSVVGENEADLRAWLELQTPEMCTLFSTRAAARVFPLVARSHNSNDRLALATGRALLTSGVAARMPAQKIKEARDAAFVAAAAKAATSPKASDAAANDCVAGSIAYAADAAYSDHADAAKAADAAASGAGGFLQLVEGTPFVEEYADRQFDFQTLLSSPLWPGREEPKWLQLATNERNDFWETGASWAFWRRWYHGMLIGQPLDWELQRRVALIENDIWEAGPDKLADEIARIEAAYEVEKRASELEAKAQTGVQASRGIGDNNPPSPIEDAIKTSDGVTIIWAAAQELKEEAQIETPNKDRVKKAAGVLVGVLKACGLWAGKKLDKGLDAAITSAGKEIGKRLVQALSATVIARITGLDDLIFGLIEAVQRWLPFITG